MFYVVSGTARGHDVNMTYITLAQPTPVINEAPAPQRNNIDTAQNDTDHDGQNTRQVNKRTRRTRQGRRRRNHHNGHDQQQRQSQTNQVNDTNNTNTTNKHISIAAWNVHRLSSKRNFKLKDEHFVDILKQHNIVLLSETWANRRCDLSVPGLEHFSVYRSRPKNARRDSGGLTIY